MPSEHIGNIDTGQLPHDRAWVAFCLEWAAQYLKHVVGQPKGYQLEVIWHDHELASYPSLGVTWDGPHGPPREWLPKWEFALNALDEAIDWSAIEPAAIQAGLEAEAERLADEGDEDLDKDDEDE